MELIKAIKNRRSISEFEKRPVDRKVIDELISIASFAPSSCNTQPWYFLIFDKNESKKTLNEYVEKGYRKTEKKLRAKHKVFGVAYARLLRFFSIYGKFDIAPVEILLFARPYDTPVFSQAIKTANNEELKKIAQSSVNTSVAMAMQNLLLAAHSKGLGTRVKDGIKFMMNDLELKNKFYKQHNIPQNYELISGIQLGYPTKKALKRKADARKNLDGIRKYS